MSVDIPYEEHVQKNNQRLISIRNSLSELATFNSACSELTQWCSDQRAFTACFEDNLMLALQVAVENGTKDGFDFSLAHQLISTCFSYRKKLSKNNANRINRWYEQFRRLKKSGGKKKKRMDFGLPMAPDTVLDQMVVTDRSFCGLADHIDQLQPSSAPAPPPVARSFCGLADHIDQLQPSSAPAPPPVASGTMWPTGGPMPGPSPMQSPAYGAPPNAMMPMQSYGMQQSPYPPMDPAGARAYPADPNMMYDQQAQMQMQMQRHQQMIMMQQQHQQQQLQMQQQQQQQMNSVSVQPVAQPTKKTKAARRRATPAQAQAPIQPTGQPFDQMYPVPMGVNNVPGQTQPLMRVPSQTGMPSPAYGRPMNGMMPQRGMMMPMTSPGYPQSQTQMIRAGPPQLFGQMQQQPPQQQQVMSCLNPALPSNNMQSMQMPFYSQPLKDILPTFQLDHNMDISNFTFNLSADDMKQIQSHNVEIQLKCFYNTDATEKPNWAILNEEDMSPATLITLNGHPVPLKSLRHAMYVKNRVIMGINNIEFNARKCVCSHRFVLRFVQLVSLNNLVENITTRHPQSASYEFYKNKVMQFVPNDGLRLSLMCSFSYRRLSIPVRFSTCRHVQCFDLHFLLVNQSEHTRMECPICLHMHSIEDLEIDAFAGKCVQESHHMKPQPTEMFIEPTGIYKYQVAPVNNNIVNRKRTREEATNGPAFPMTRIKSEQFPTQPGEASPFQSANSVPMMSAFNSGSPASMMSPFAPSVSPNKPAASPMGARFVGGPGTPITPGSSNEVKQEVQHSSSPHQAQIQQHGSVETPSLTGSAPYTPASQSSGVNQVTTSTEQPFSNIQNLSASLDLDVVEGLITTHLFSEDDFQKYLCTVQDEPSMKDSQMGWSNESWDDFNQLLSAGKI